MENNLIIVKEGKPYVGTWALSKMFKVQHRYFLKALKKHSADFEKLGVVTLNNINHGLRGGRKVKEYLLNEEQAAFLSSLMKNSPSVKAFKLFLTTEFVKQRDLINKAKNSIRPPRYPGRSEIWVEIRERGKIDRRYQTDIIKKFTEYCIAQGSTHSGNYYCKITEMENKNLFHMEMLMEKVPNVRNVVGELGLSALQILDRIIGNALLEGMSREMYYKDIYRLAEERTKLFVSMHGKVPIDRMGHELKAVIDHEKKLKEIVEGDKR